MLRAVLLVESICREVDTVQVRIAHPVFPGSFGILHLVRFESIKYFLTRNLQARKNEGPQVRTSAEPADNIWDLPSKDISVVYSNWGKIISALLLTTPFVFLTDFFSFSLKKENSRSVTYRWKANMKWKKSKKSVHSYLHGHAVEISWHWSSRGGSVSNGVGACFTEMNFRCGYAQTPPCYLQKNAVPTTIYKMNCVKRTLWFCCLYIKVQGLFWCLPVIFCLENRFQRNSPADL